MPRLNRGDKKKRRVPRSKQSKEEASNRRAERFADYGRDMERRVELILEKMCERGLIERFVYHEPNSIADREGKDFTVVGRVNDEEKVVHFGITISMRSWMAAKLRRPHVPQFHFPIKIKDETVEKRVMKLLADG